MSTEAGLPLWDLEGFWEPIFASPGRRYELFTEAQASPKGDALLLRGEEGAQAHLVASSPRPWLVRVTIFLEKEPPWTSPMIARQVPSLPIPWQENNQGWEASAHGLKVRLASAPLALDLATAHGDQVWGWKPWERSLVGATALPLGISWDAEGRPSLFLSWGLEPNERLLGLGEQFGPLERRGRRYVLWCRDPKGALSPVTYLPIPLLLSSRGYGLFLHHPAPSVWELGEPFHHAASLMVASSYLDLWFILGSTPAQILARYTWLTGRAPLIPLWALGTWFSRCMYRDRAQVQGIVERLRDLGIPGDVIHLDPLWLEGRAQRPLDGCHFRWNQEAFGKPAEFVSWLSERGFKLCLWENPYIWQGTELFQEGWKRGYLVATKGGNPAPSLDNPEATPVDFFNRDGARWWQDQHRPYLKAGVAAFKADYGEGLPKDCITADGREGLEVHNLYPLLYQQAVFQAVKEGRGEGVIFARSGYAGCQRYPVHWTGDPPSTWEGMAASLRAGLSLSLSGLAWWSHDIGGFWNPDGLKPPPKELYIRWAQFGLLSPIARFHGIRGREPWYYGDDAVAIVRRFVRLRYRLLPYLWALAHEAKARGLPVARPLLLEFPSDKTSWRVDWEFLLGPYILVVPVMHPGGRATIYLPPGVWHHWWTGERLVGPQWREERVPLAQMPIYVRDDSILPLAPVMDYVGQRSWSPLTLQLRVTSQARFRFWTPREATVVEATRYDDLYHLALSPTRRLLRIHLVGMTAIDVNVEGAHRATITQGRRGTVITLRGSGVPIKIRAKGAPISR